MGYLRWLKRGQDSARAAVSRAPLSADDAGVNNARLNEIRLQESLIHDWFLLVTVGFCMQPVRQDAEEFVFLIYMKKILEKSLECSREMEN